MKRTVFKCNSLLSLFFCSLIFLLLCAFVPSSAHAQSFENDMAFPPQAVSSANERLVPQKTTHPPLHMTPDQSMILEFDKPIGRIILPHAQHINILRDAEKRAVVIPHAPGTTYFIILDTNGETLMKRHVIVASPKQNYLRIRRNCNGGSRNCEQTSVYWCPNMCHQMHISDGGNPAAAGGTIAPEGNGDSAMTPGNMPIGPDGLNFPPIQMPQFNFQQQ